MTAGVAMKDGEVFRKTLIDLIAEKWGTFEAESWAADYRLNWNDELSELMGNAVSDVSRVAQALKNKDDVELCVAAGRARTGFLDLSNFFRGIFDDFDALVRETEWQEIPDDYVYDKT